MEGRVEAGVDSSTESDGEGGERLQRMEAGHAEQGKQKPGIVYLSSVPTGYNVSQTTAFFSEFGKVGRIFLQPDKTDKKTGKYQRVFSEGWVEFLSKKVAKSVAASLNTIPVGGKRRSKSHDELWNIKYLPRFKWIHLSERLAYEAAVRQQRMRTEISQVKREAEHFKESVEKSRKKAKKEKSSKEGGDEATKPSVPFQFKQRETESQITKRKRDESGFTVKDIDKSDPKKKKTKKSKEEEESGSTVVSVQVKSTRSRPRRAKELKAGLRSGGGQADRSEFLKSVFGMQT